MRHKFLLVSMILCFMKINLLAETISDNTSGYTITLPDGWIMSVVDSTHHIFEDTTDQRNSLIGIKTYKIQELDNSFTEKEWVETNFLVYYLLASVESTNVVIYYDTLIATEVHKRYTADIYTFFFDPENQSTGDIAEYVRYTANGNLGYEIYAIGPISDMDTNLIYYLTIIENISFINLTNEVNYSPISYNNFQNISSMSVFPEVDLLGRNIKNKKLAFQSFVSKGRSCLLRRIGN